VDRLIALVNVVAKAAMMAPFLFDAGQIVPTREYSCIRRDMLLTQLKCETYCATALEAAGELPKSGRQASTRRLN
jgi:hypothetical protein